MPSTSETGHAKNIANFQTLISFCTGYGATYNPSRTAIQLPELNSLYIQARDSITQLNTIKTTYTHAVNERQLLFEPLKKRVTRIINALDATEATDKLVQDARTIVNKIQGRRTGSKTTNTNEYEEEPTKTISVSQQSYDSITENFAALIELLNSEPTYTPNETELQVATLQTLLNDLRAANLAVANANTQYSNARIARNNILYTPQTGLADIALDVKKYVKSIFGATSPEFKQISSLEFIKAK